MKKYTQMSKTEYDNVLHESYGAGVHVVDMGDGTYRVMKFVGYEDGDAEFEFDDSYPVAYPIDDAAPDEGIVVEGIEGVVFGR